jgi:hypothetical protein
MDIFAQLPAAVEFFGLVIMLFAVVIFADSKRATAGDSYAESNIAAPRGKHCRR